MAHWYFHTKVSLWVGHPGCMDVQWAGCLIIFLALSTHFSVLLPSEKGSASVANRMCASSRWQSGRKSPADPGRLVPYEMEEGVKGPLFLHGLNHHMDILSWSFHFIPHSGSKTSQGESEADTGPLSTINFSQTVAFYKFSHMVKGSRLSQSGKRRRRVGEPRGSKQGNF